MSGRRGYQAVGGGGDHEGLDYSTCGGGNGSEPKQGATGLLRQPEQD